MVIFFGLIMAYLVYGIFLITCRTNEFQLSRGEDVVTKLWARSTEHALKRYAKSRGFSSYANLERAEPEYRVAVSAVPRPLLPPEPAPPLTPKPKVPRASTPFEKSLIGLMCFGGYIYVCLRLADHAQIDFWWLFLGSPVVVGLLVIGIFLLFAFAVVLLAFAEIFGPIIIVLAALKYLL